MSQTASARKQAHARAQGTWRCAGRGISYVEEFRTQAGDMAPGAELVLVPVSVPMMTVLGRNLGHRLPLICTSVATAFPAPDSSAAVRRNWCRGNSLLSCVVRSVGGEQQK
jgi:hypothetical protein